MSASLNRTFENIGTIQNIKFDVVIQLNVVPAFIKQKKKNVEIKASLGSTVPLCLKKHPLLFLFLVLGIKARALHMLGKHLTTKLPLYSQNSIFICSPTTIHFYIHSLTILWGAVWGKRKGRFFFFNLHFLNMFLMKYVHFLNMFILF